LVAGTFSVVSGTRAFPLEWRFSGVGAESFLIRPMAASVMPCVGRAEVVDVDRGQLVMRRLQDVAVVVHLDELAPFGGGHGRERRAARA
jgi:hypothetical protein